MPIERTSTDDWAWSELLQIEASFEALNERIARLSIGLGLELSHDHQIHELLCTPQAPQAHDLHQARSWTELRGLLVLRYSMEKNLAEKIGVETLKQILIEAESHLERSGFKPGAAGEPLSSFEG